MAGPPGLSGKGSQGVVFFLVSNYAQQRECSFEARRQPGTGQVALCSLSFPICQTGVLPPQCGVLCTLQTPVPSSRIIQEGPTDPLVVAFSC